MVFLASPEGGALKSDFFGHLVVQIPSKHPYCHIRINVHVKMVPTMYITWGLRKKKFWCSVLRAHNRAPFVHNCIHRSVQRSGRPKKTSQSLFSYMDTDECGLQGPGAVRKRPKQQFLG